VRPRFRYSHARLLSTSRPGGPDVERAVRPKLTRDGDSGYRVLDSNEDALRWRLALIDSARYSLDVQYYFWWEDECGELVLSTSSRPPIAA
jgi:phosphatidylserine/phosphatidylglycerophosphate/cardiolipin synthase-like enzyme